MPNLMQLFQNLLGIVAAVSGNVANPAYDTALRKYRAAVRTLKLSLLIPLVFYLIGMIVGTVGAEGAASMIFAIGGFIGVALFIAFWMKGFIYSYLVMLATDVISAANPTEKELPRIERAKIDSALTWLRSYNAWYAAVNLMCSLLPLWHSWYWSIIIATCVIGLSSVMSAWATKSVWPRRFATWGMVGAIVVAVFNIAFPDLARAVTSYGDRQTEELATELERRSVMTKAARSGETERRERDAKLLESFRARQKALEDRAAAGCVDYEDADKRAGSPYCSAADKRAHAGLTEKIRRLEGGTYWDSRPAQRSSDSSGATKQPAKAAPPPIKGEASSTARLRPPEKMSDDAPPPREKVRPSRDSGRGGGGSGPVPNLGGIDWDYVLQPLPPRRR